MADDDKNVPGGEQPPVPQDDPKPKDGTTDDSGPRGPAPPPPTGK